MRAAITKSLVDKIEPGSIVWDTRVSGFGARRQRGPAVNYVLKAQGEVVHDRPTRIALHRRDGAKRGAKASRLDCLRRRPKASVEREPWQRR